MLSEMTRTVVATMLFLVGAIWGIAFLALAAYGFSHHEAWTWASENVPPLAQTLLVGYGGMMSLDRLATSIRSKK